MKNTKEKSDSELVILSLKNQAFFAKLIDRYEKKLSRYIYRLSGLNTESIEDILQEAFIKMYINLNNYNPEYSFSSWAYRITHNESVNYLRKNKKHIIIPLETEGEDKNLIDTLKSEIDLESELSENNLTEQIRELINMLPEKYREVLVLRYMEDMDYKEISDILKMPMGTVATTINRAKEKFKKLAKKMKINF